MTAPWKVYDGSGNLLGEKDSLDEAEELCPKYGWIEDGVGWVIAR